MKGHYASESVSVVEQLTRLLTSQKGRQWHWIQMIRVRHMYR
ncbi:hypothetical protein EV191_1011236 [Tamaricihabitans halophyticus]|uniref:Uncharacterized protein n=1 Tax=Tamaricihabitans halophyticus TaxID=1262583 RepID=A0A4R2R396_9PSEU|nr:hypothetical protein EV191_1011236 [Tamaricihabitans halophyticus]